MLTQNKKMNNKLYQEFAGYYAAMSNQRDFKGQMDCILDLYAPEEPCRSMLELFSGQSFHSIEALGKGNIDVWAIDSSPEMKELALGAGFPKAEQYIVGNLPEALLAYTDQVKFDCILCLYHGLSNITMKGVYEALSHLKNLLNKNGRLFLEIHNIEMMMEYLTSPIVQIKELRTPERTDLVVKYAWPSAKISWNPFDYNAIVPIKLILESSRGTETIEVTSQDRIFSAENIMFIAELLGYNSRILTDEVPGRVHFGNSVILELSIPS